MEFIKASPDNQTFIFNKEGYPKINLIRGPQAFIDCANWLRTLEPVAPLEMNDEITIKVPENSDDMNRKEKILELIKDKKIEISSLHKYKHFSFHYDNGSINAEISALLQIVDDNNSNSQRRNNIFNPNFHFLGVSVGKLKLNRFIIYLTFASDI
jgi:hypothetical protein